MSGDNDEAGRRRRRKKIEVLEMRSTHSDTFCNVIMLESITEIWFSFYMVSSQYLA